MKMKSKLTIGERLAAFIIAWLMAVPLGVLLMLMCFAAGLAVLFGIESATLKVNEQRRGPWDKNSSR